VLVGFPAGSELRDLCSILLAGQQRFFFAAEPLTMDETPVAAHMHTRALARALAQFVVLNYSGLKRSS
jgi:hypothetical protein